MRIGPSYERAKRKCVHHEMSVWFNERERERERKRGEFELC